MKTGKGIKTVLVLVVVMAFAMTGCDSSGGGGDNNNKNNNSSNDNSGSGSNNDNGDNGNNSGDAVTGLSSLVLSGQVYGEDDSQFKGSLNILGVFIWYDDIVNIGTGRITNGVLNYTIGTPSNSLLTSYKDFEREYMFSPNETASNENVKFLFFDTLKTDLGEFNELVKANINFKSETFS